MSQKKYWKGLEELHETPAFTEAASNEFKEDLPFDLSGGLLKAETPRRDFLKFLGFSTAAAMVAASCEMPVRKVIPYAIKPEDIQPGVANYYASTFVDGGDYCAVVVKTRDGRPIKVDANAKSSITGCGTSARVQASVLNLYDNARLRQPMAGGKEETFANIDKMVKDGLAAASGKTIYLLTSTIISPTSKEVIAKFLAKYPNAKHVTYDSISYSGMLSANQESYGVRALPSYHFDKAKTIVSLDADFLGTWLSPVEYSYQYALTRKVDAKNPNMSRHYHIESAHTTTGAAADYRATCRPSELGAVAVSLLNAVNGTAPAFSNKHLNELITKAAGDLKKGNGMVVCGSNDKNVQVVVNAINSAIGANGTTINWATTANYKQGNDAEMVALVADMNADKVGALLMLDVNPAYDYFEADKFKSGLAKVATTVSFADRLDETAQLVKFVTPDNHWLESWGDAEPKTGYYSLMQPTIAPLFKTRAYQESLLRWADAGTDYHTLWSNFWTGKLGGQAALDQALQNGVIEPAAPAMSGGSFSGNVSGAIAAIQAAPKGAEMELVLYPTVAIGYGGAWSNNPWLQEMSDPITKATWDNYICMSPKTAKEKFDAELTSITEVEANKKQAKITWNGKEMLLPIVVVPGMHNDVVAVAVGYGRDKGVGRAAASGVDKNGKPVGGKNAYPFVRFNEAAQTFDYANTAIKIAPDNSRHEVAITQTHHSYEGRPIIHEFTLEEFSKDPEALLRERYAEIGHFTEKPWEHHEKPAKGYDPEMDAKFRDEGTLYPDHTEEPKYEAIHWGMSVDLNACTGCGACVVACQAENNISVVGKTHVLKAQEMHWLRIDRYFSGDPNNPDTIQTVFQPMMCQHCDNAPCENVCPVNATSHSSEGLNQMTYNRCIGTKYCANNCPYKVRHFNWMDWNGADCFDDNLYEDGRRDMMNDDLTRMVLNPDVTVRSRGVMEKCTFCVQRLQEAKLTAKKEGTPLQDKHLVTACASACASGCFTFGNVNDPESKIARLRNNTDKERVFYVLEQLHVLPNVNYLAKIRNTDKITAGSSEDLMINKSKLIS